ncbi:hypothetical protein RhiLY_00750 [Ceratobasidium sp. AG-Ba]|nr:hypothetical protein RhiLY_00750 [Ceratobasidium sp. AG-Ba]
MTPPEQMCVTQPAQPTRLDPVLINSCPPRLGIPIDVVLGVIDEASTNYTTLRSCCLVNRTISSYAQALLFRSVRLESYRHFVAYSRAVCPSTARGRLLGELARSLSLSCEHVVVLQQYDRLALRDIAKLLPSVPKLRHLELFLRGTLDLLPDDLQVFSRAKSITSLHLHNHTKFGQTVVHDILTALPQITKLWLSGSAFKIVTGREPLGLTLSELHWHISLEPSALELKWLLGESSALESFSVDIPQENRSTTFSERLLQLVLQRYGANLHSLRLSDRVNSLGFVDVACPELSELLLRFWPTPEVLGTLPHELTHLGLARPDETIANEPALHELMTSLSDLSKLRTLSWLDRNGVSTNERTELRKFCHARGIAVREHDCGAETQSMFPRRTFGSPIRRWITMPD